MNWKQVKRRKHDCPFLQYNTKCTNKDHAALYSKTTKVYCAYNKCLECPYLKDSSTSIKKSILEASKRLKPIKQKESSDES